MGINKKSDLETYFRTNNSRLIHKWIHYFDIYERHFNKFRDTEVVILEIGVSHGGSLQMWKDYFGEKATIFGVDIDPRCKDFEEENIKICIGSQSNRSFLRALKKKIPKVDILIDDGGHTMEQQIVSYEELFCHVKENGIYVCEDLHTSYWLRYGGGHKRRGTFIEYSKNFIDHLNAFHSEQKSLQVNAFTTSVDSIHYYDSMIVIEKRKIEAPYDEQTGIASFRNEGHQKRTKTQKIKEKYRLFFLTKINKILRFFGQSGFIWK